VRELALETAQESVAVPSQAPVATKDFLVAPVQYRESAGLETEFFAQLIEMFFKHFVATSSHFLK
jgi:hypothetical protein